MYGDGKIRKYLGGVGGVGGSCGGDGELDYLT